MSRYNLEYNDDGTFTGYYAGMPWLEATSDSAAQALEDIQDLVEVESERAGAAAFDVTVRAGGDYFYDIG